MPRRDQPIPDEPPSSRTLPEHERRDRAQTLEWMHEAAAPHRKKRKDPEPDPMWMKRAERAFGKGIFDEDD
jgi:hypothetical protein